MTKENQTRSMATNFSTREETSGEKIIEGYFAVFNQETELWPGAFEEISPEAFNGSLSNDIRALTNHETTLVLGRNKSGTLKLSVDSRGLWGQITINENDSDALNLYERVKRGDVDQCSFGFNILNEETDWREDGTVKWLLKEIDLHEVSVVTFPAYEDTGVQARHTQLEQYREKQTKQWRKKLLSQLKNRGN
ncbi:HK97 family phage prohead protease [Enterococcus sp. DIV0609]|nr:HK97 family phage prohead protease [Enterococcus faecalis]EOD96891.1 HK97 family phage prohead protease [Enterococcus faecalis EnGen0074]EOE04861.1 HK97 family phage prohead protease [Enterococcus faecalis EnGen0058]EOF35709.1 HK97 family phage prohead protease [Enterococcus faecalis EnGen0103]EOF36003.1 HK97 family phage prohead protease [Enterococcus faecalis EnGen0102]EOF42255.1 HK97 family phage prohead protease [Enterococcus faecalis EnGen0104]EOF43884.1 HK97 family phage prohead prot